MGLLRDSIRDSKYFNAVISERHLSNERRFKKLHEGLIASDRMQAVKVDMAKNFLYSTIIITNL